MKWNQKGGDLKLKRKPQFNKLKQMYPTVMSEFT